MTKDEKDRDKPTAKACVEKTRVADMNIFSPKRGFDFRISISVETPGGCDSMLCCRGLAARSPSC